MGKMNFVSAQLVCVKLWNYILYMRGSKRGVVINYTRTPPPPGKHNYPSDPDIWTRARAWFKPPLVSKFSSKSRFSSDDYIAEFLTKSFNSLLNYYSSTVTRRVDHLNWVHAWEFTCTWRIPLNFSYISFGTLYYMYQRWKGRNTKEMEEHKLVN